jgi:hypothetical protein
MPPSPQDAANVNAPRSSGVGPAADDDTEITAMAGNQRGVGKSNEVRE